MSSEQGWRGGEQQLAYLLEGLSARNVYNVMAVRQGSQLEHFSTRKGLRCYPLRFSGSFDLTSARAVSKICKSENVDLIHLHNSKAQGVGVLSSLFGNSLPMVLSRRVAFLPGKNIFSRWKYNHKQIRRILCVSEKIRTIMQGYLAEPTRCVTVYSGIDLGKFDGLSPDRAFLVKEFGLDPGKHIVIAVGAVDESKDHFTFVDTVLALAEAGVNVQGLLVGEGPLLESVRGYAAAKVGGDSIRFAGQRTDVGRLLVSADLFLMTSKEEGLGTSILDAFLAHVPVVATETGGIPEIVRNEDTGLTAPVGDAGKLAAQARSVLTDRALRDRLISRASKFVQGFSKEEMSSGTFKIYKEVLER